MNDRFIKSMPHQPKRPVEIERLPGDVLFIEGVKYSGDYFRTMAEPAPDQLYAIRKDDTGAVYVFVIESAEEAVKYFEETQNAL